MSYWHPYNRCASPSPRLEVENGEARFEALLSKDITERDKEFMTSLRDQLLSKGGLSSKQIACLVRTEGKYDPSAIAERKAWVASYADRHRETAIICAKFYVTTQYFRDLATRVLTEEGFVPTQRQWQAMCCNKYAEKAIIAATAKPIFPTGTLCKVRKNRDTRPAHQNELALVVANHPSGLYASSTVLVNGETVIYDDRRLKSLTRKRKSE